MTEQLKTCPFCGGEMQFRKALWPSDGCTDSITHAEPSECGMLDFSTNTTDESVIAAWNRRSGTAASNEGTATCKSDVGAPSSIPEGWVPLRIEFEPGYPEDVAFGPQIMMDRLKKWLDKYFAAIREEVPTYKQVRQEARKRMDHYAQTIGFESSRDPENELGFWIHKVMSAAPIAVTAVPAHYQKMIDWITEAVDYVNDKKMSPSLEEEGRRLLSAAPKTQLGNLDKPQNAHLSRGEGE